MDYGDRLFERCRILSLFAVAVAALAMSCDDASSACADANCAGAPASGGADPVGGMGSGGDGSGGAPFEPQPGLRAEFFADYLDLALERVDATLDFVWVNDGPGAPVPADRFSARWTGSLVAPATGTYTIATETDDGVRVWVDDILLIDDWHAHFVTRNEASVDLVAGAAVGLRVDYFELDLEASARLLWSSAALPEEVIPTASLRTAPPLLLPSPKPPYTNPVIPFDCPDPGVLALPNEDPPIFAAVCTGGKFRIRTSRSLVSWANTDVFILPDGKPPWAANGNRNWAPELHAVGDGVMAYFTSVNGGNVLSVGAASAPSIDGPFTDLGAPLVQNPVGVIDASYFEDDDGSKWLLDKIDGNSQGDPTPIRIRELTADGRAFADGSSPQQILVNQSSTWEGGVVEAPWLVKRDGMYYLFYSGNVYDDRYRTGVARSAALLGPYEKHSGPILQNNETWVGPGHGSVVVAGGLDYFVYHAWRNDGSGGNDTSQGRNVLVDRIQWQDGWPVIHDGTPSRTPVPWPGEAE